MVTCEFSGELLKVSTLGHRVLGALHFDPRPDSAPSADPMTMGRSVPQDVRISPDGKTFYVADMGTNELRLIDARTFRQVGVIGMPRDAARDLSQPRREATSTSPTAAPARCSVLDLATNRIVDTWTIPGGGSPDMGGVSADGRMLWLSGRSDGVVYGFDTRTAGWSRGSRSAAARTVIAVWPQPGRYSLGHTGNMR